MADWVSPTGKADPGSDWHNEQLAHDDNLGTLASCSNTPNGQWTDYIELWYLDGLSCSKVRVYMQNSNDTNPYVEIGVLYGGSWNSIFTGTITKSVWVEKEIGSTETVTKMRVRWYNDTGELMTVRFYEADFYGDEIVVGGAMTLNTGFWGSPI